MHQGLRCHWSDVCWIYSSRPALARSFSADSMPAACFLLDVKVAMPVIGSGLLKLHAKVQTGGLCLVWVNAPLPAGYPPEERYTEEIHSASLQRGFPLQWFAL